MRVSELAKHLGLPTGMVLSQAKQMEIEVSTTLSSLDDDDVQQLKNHYATMDTTARKQACEAYEAQRTERRKKSEATRVEQVKAARQAVEATRQKALEADAHKRGVPLEAAKPVVAETPAPVTEVAAPVKDEKKPVKEEKKAKPTFETIEIVHEMKDSTSIAVSDEEEEPVTPTYTAEEDEEDEEAELATRHMRARDKAPAPQQRPHNNQRNENNRNANNNGNRNNRGNDNRNNRDTRNNRNDRNNRGNAFGKKGAPTPAPAAATVASATVEGKTIKLRAPLTVKELADLMGTRANMLIADLMKLSVLASINQRLELEVTQKVAEKYGFTVEMEERTKRSSERKPVLKSEDADDEIPEDKPEQMKLRPPVVTFLGHVDHGKTTLMDYIRKAHVAAGEAGGITQHIAAYTIEVDQLDDDGNRRLITFVDTPGHSAFESMRARGANITDIAVIIVAADDGVMPQTREAIKHARNAGVQMLVAVTKCDKPDANPMRVYQMLQAEGLTPSTWGGDIECCEVSGTTGLGVEELLETILIQADVLELQANPDRRANGAVIESQLEQGLGPTATLLVQGGTLNVGDVVLCGEHYGKVRSLIDERGKPTKHAGPSIAVKCTGLSGVPEAGSVFRVMLTEKRARELAEKTAEENKLQSLSAAQSSAMADWTKMLGSDGKAELDVIVKGDTQGTAEAVVECLKAIESKKVSLKILYSGVGSVTAADVQRAKDATIVGFSVNCEPGVQGMARQNGVRINTFRIIYELIEHIKRCMMDLIPPEYKEVVRGHAEIRQVFDISKLGKIAGSQLMDGSLRFKGKYRIFRGKHIIYDGPLSTMKHFKEDVTEVTGAQECGLGFGSFEDFREGDTIECYEMEELPKTL